MRNMGIYIGYAGTYTKKSSEGIYQFKLNVDQGILYKSKLAAGVSNPTYLAATDDYRHIFSVAQDGDLGGIHGYKIDPYTHTLKKIGSSLTEGKPPCHLNIWDNKLVTGNYHKGEIKLHTIDRSGDIKQDFSITRKGSGPHKRQEKSHIHYTGFSSKGSYIFVCDLGSDELITYKVKSDKLERKTALKLKSGSGPRHLIFHPNLQYAYLITELSSEVVSLKYCSETGTFTEIQYINTIPESFKGTNATSAIRISSDGQYVYAGNRGHNSITVFKVDNKTMELSLVERVSSGGEWPRDFVLDPSERFLITSNQFTDNVVLFSRDKKTGKLFQSNSEINIPEVVCLKFIK